nr:leucine-rich repeat domain-containing protein [Nostoc sp. 'Peltigera malacea cyanobiont' DB3992]
MTQEELLQLIDRAVAEGWQELDLSGQELTELPVEIGKLQQLESLILGKKVESDEYVGSRYFEKVSGNNLKTLPLELLGLPNLRKLDISGNPLESIPDVVTQILHLEELILIRGELTEIPDAIANLTNLTQLVLSDNQITQIPEAIESLPKLKNLDLRGNPLPISPEILGSFDDVGSVEDIFNYLRLLRSGEVRPLNEAKLLLIGQGSVGKTSLIERLIRDKYDQNQSQTDGLNVETWNVQVNSKDIRLNVWDFGGQEIYHATHQFF